MQVRRIKMRTRCPLFAQLCLWSTTHSFATPCLRRSLQRSLLSPHPSFWGGKGPFRKLFAGFRHSRVTPGGLLVILDTARVHLMTQGHSAAFPFLQLWQKTFPSQQPLWTNAKEQHELQNVFSHVVFCYWWVKSLSQEMSEAQRWRRMISGQKWNLQAQLRYWTRLLSSPVSQLPG